MPTGLPNVRMVLLKEIEDDAFVFYTNYDSAKAQEIATAPARRPSCMHWKSLRRQVRVRGTVDARGRAAGRCLLRVARAREPAGGLGLGAVAAAGLARGADGRGRADHGAPRHRSAAPAVLGRLPDRPLEIEFWADGTSAARPVPLERETLGATTGRSHDSTPDVTHVKRIDTHIDACTSACIRIGELETRARRLATIDTGGEKLTDAEEGDEHACTAR